MSLQLGLDVSQAGRVTVLVVRGELDASTAPDLERLLDLVLRAGSAEVAVDMGDLAFIDSHGLQALVNLRDRCVAAGGDLLLYRPRRLALRLLDATGLRDRVRIVGAPATIAQAV